MHRFCRLPLVFDPARLRAELERFKQDRWTAHYVPSNYEGEWSAIALRSVTGQAEHAYADPIAPPETYHDTPALGACPYLQDVLRAFRCPVASTRLLKLSIGSHIREHVDHDLDAKSGWARLHIPLVTHPDVEFYVEDERVVMAEGECWYIDASLPHRLTNASPVDRVHLVLDCLVNDWLREQLQAGGYVARAPNEYEVRGVREQDAGKVIEALRAMGTEVGAQLAMELQRSRDRG